jgi:hypothetical protein
MHLLDPRSGGLSIAVFLFISGTVLYSWIQAARRQNFSSEKSEPVDEKKSA